MSFVITQFCCAMPEDVQRDLFYPATVSLKNQTLTFVLCDV